MKKIVICFMLVCLVLISFSGCNSVADSIKKNNTQAAQIIDFPLEDFLNPTHSATPFFDIEEGPNSIDSSEILSVISEIPSDKYEQYPMLHSIPLAATLYKNGKATSIDIRDPRLIRLINLYNNCVYYDKYAYTQGLLPIDYLEEASNEDFRLVISFKPNKESTIVEYDTNIEGYDTFIITNEDFTLIDFDSTGYEGEEDRYPFKAVGHFPLFNGYCWLDLFGF